MRLPIAATLLATAAAAPRAAKQARRMQARATLNPQGQALEVTDRQRVEMKYGHLFAGVESTEADKAIEHSQPQLEQPQEGMASPVFAALEDDTSLTTVDAIYAVPTTLDFVITVGVTDADTGEVVETTCILDTGSSNFAVSVSECTDCDTGSEDLELDLNDDYCISVVYGSGSWSGNLAEDVVVTLDSEILSGETITTTTNVAAITSGPGFFFGGYTGILGLAYDDLSNPYTACDTSDTSLESIAAGVLTDSFVDDGLIDDVVTIAFCGLDAVVTFGGVDDDLIVGDSLDVDYASTVMTYDSYYGYYLVTIESIDIDGATITADDGSDFTDDDFNPIVGGSLVDSGTTLLYLPTAVYDVLQAEIQDATGLDDSWFAWTSCLTDEDVIDSYPTITIHMNDDTDLVMEPREWMIDYYGCYYWGVDEYVVTIIGNVPLQNKAVVFDRVNNLVGFADDSCDIVEDALSSSTSSHVTSSDNNQVNHPQFEGTPAFEGCDTYLDVEDCFESLPGADAADCAALCFGEHEFEVNSAHPNGNFEKEEEKVSFAESYDYDVDDEEEPCEGGDHGPTASATLYQAESYDYDSDEGEGQDESEGEGEENRGGRGGEGVDSGDEPPPPTASESLMSSSVAAPMSAAGNSSLAVGLLALVVCSALFAAHGARTRMRRSAYRSIPV